MNTRNSQHAINIMCHLAREKSDKPVKLRSVSLHTNIPLHTVSQLMQALGRRHIVSTTRGSLGGVTLNRPASEILMQEVVCAVDGPPELCTTLTTLGRCEPASGCPIPALWQRRAEALSALVSHPSLDEFAQIHRPEKNECGEEIHEAIDLWAS